jgi:DNA replication protein DnaC
MSQKLYPQEIQELAKKLNLCAFEDYKSHIKPGGDFSENLLTLLSIENDLRDKNFIRRRIKQAGFPIQKTIDTFEFCDKRLPHLCRDTVMELITCDFIKEKTNICALGNSGTGKTHLMTAIGMEAIRKGYIVKFRRASDLVTQLAEAQSEKRLGSMLRQLHSCQLLLLDELCEALHNSSYGKLNIMRS